MRFPICVLGGALLALLASPSFAADAPPPPPAHDHDRTMMHGFLSPEERMMLMADMMKATANMSDDQKHAWRHQQRERLMAMSDSDRAKFKADLDARWAALPADQKAAMQARMQEWRDHRGGDHGPGTHD